MRDLLRDEPVGRFRAARGASVLALLLAVLPKGAQAQGENHWFNQFGDQAFLLSGAVIGGVSDLGAVFYNPGRLGQSEEAGSFQATNGFQVTGVTVDDGLGPGKDLLVTNVRNAPSFAAGALTLPTLPDHTFAYSYMTRRGREAELNLSRATVGDGSIPLPGAESAIERVDIKSELKEYWFGLSWATVMGAGIRLGVSAFGTYSTRDHLALYDLRGSPASGPVFVQRARRYELTGWGVLFKAGLAVTRGPFDFGLTVTSPQIDVSAKGKLLFEDANVVTDTTSDATSGVLYTAARQEDLPAQAKTPLAIGVGVAWRIGRGVLYASAEWYSGIPLYTNVVSGPIFDSRGNSVGPYRVVSELTSVFNVGAGVRWDFWESLAAYASFAWDPSPEGSAPPPPTEGELSRTGFLLGDATHIGVGAFVRTRWFEATAGVSYARAKDVAARPFPLSASTPPVLWDDGLDITSRTLRFQIGLLLFVGGDRAEA